MAGKTAPVDKAQLQLMARIERAMKDVDEALKGFNNDSDKSEQVKQVKALQARIDAAEQAGGPAAIKTLTTSPRGRSNCTVAQVAAERAFRRIGASRELQGARRPAFDPALTKLLCNRD